MSAKVAFVIRQDEPQEKRLIFWCPGCNAPHQVRIAGPAKAGPVWTFNGDIEKPILGPSLLTEGDTPHRCHMFINNGMIEYCHDSHHHLAGKTVEIPNLDTWR